MDYEADQVLVSGGGKQSIYQVTATPPPQAMQQLIPPHDIDTVSTQLTQAAELIS